VRASAGSNTDERRACRKRSVPLTQPLLERCSVIWWRGYVRGRLQAVAGSPPTVVAESRPLRGDAEGPEQTAEATAAADELTQRLVDEGWVPAEDDREPWYARSFTRPSVAPVPDRPAAAREIDTRLVEVLHDELREALDTAERERRGRLAAERHLHAVEQSSTAVENTVPQRRRRTSKVALAAWAVTVVCAAVVSAALSHSFYATAVVALTVAAVALGVDSWRISRF
jgi:hypothetical protein